MLRWFAIGSNAFAASVNGFFLLSGHTDLPWMTAACVVICGCVTVFAYVTPPGH